MWRRGFFGRWWCGVFLLLFFWTWSWWSWFFGWWFCYFRFGSCYDWYVWVGYEIPDVVLYEYRLVLFVCVCSRSVDVSSDFPASGVFVEVCCLWSLDMPGDMFVKSSWIVVL